MKKILFTTACLVFICASVFALNDFDWGAGISMGGNSQGKTTGMITGCYRPFDNSILNPSLRLNVGMEYRKAGFGFNGITAQVGLELFRTLHNPLQFTLVNKGPWAPEVSFGLGLKNEQWFFHSELSLFRTLDKDFSYEWFVVKADFNKERIIDWAVDFIRFTAFF